jgi:hypothetical protein
MIGSFPEMDESEYPRNLVDAVDFLIAKNMKQEAQLLLTVEVCTSATARSTHTSSPLSGLAGWLRPDPKQRQVESVSGDPPLPSESPRARLVGARLTARIHRRTKICGSSP